MIKRLDFAKEMGADIVISNGAVKQNAQGFFDCIEKMTPVLEDYGLVLALENPGCGVPDSIIATGVCTSGCPGAGTCTTAKRQIT